MHSPTIQSLMIVAGFIVVVLFCITPPPKPDMFREERMVWWFSKVLGASFRAVWSMPERVSQLRQKFEMQRLRKDRIRQLHHHPGWSVRAEQLRLPFVS